MELLDSAEHGGDDEPQQVGGGAAGGALRGAAQRCRAGGSGDGGARGQSGTPVLEGGEGRCEVSRELPGAGEDGWVLVDGLGRVTFRGDFLPHWKSNLPCHLGTIRN